MAVPNIQGGLAAINAKCDAECALANVPGPGRVEITTAAALLLVSIPLANPAFGPAAAGAALANGLPIGAIASGTGVATRYVVYGQAVGGSGLWEGTAADSGTPNMMLSNANINIGDNVQINAWSHVQPSS